MRLAKIIQKETGIASDEIIFLRHSNRTVGLLSDCGVSIYEYTEIQPKDTKFDYRKSGESRAKVIVAIVEDKVWGAFEVIGILQEGMPEEICSPAYLRFLELEKKPRVMRIRFELKPVSSKALGKQVQGWQGRQRTTVARSQSSFFNEIEV